MASWQIEFLYENCCVCRIVINLPSSKPKDMHWKTYVRLMAEYRDDANQTKLGMKAKMELLTKRVEALCDRLGIDP